MLDSTCAVGAYRLRTSTESVDLFGGEDSESHSIEHTTEDWGPQVVTPMRTCMTLDAEVESGLLPSACILSQPDGLCRPGCCRDTDTWDLSSVSSLSHTTGSDQESTGSELEAISGNSRSSSVDRSGLPLTGKAGFPFKPSCVETDQLINNLCIHNLAGDLIWGPATIPSSSWGQDLHRLVVEEHLTSGSVSFTTSDCILQTSRSLQAQGVVDGAVLTMLRSPNVVVKCQRPAPFSQSRLRAEAADKRLGPRRQKSLDLESSDDEITSDDDMSCCGSDIYENIEITLGPGAYRVDQDVTVSRDVSIHSDDIGEIDRGECINVVSVVLMQEEGRVRGNIDKPVSGWITMSTTYGTLWVKPWAQH